MAVATMSDRQGATRARGYALALGVLALVIAVDQVTKRLVESGITIGQTRQVVPGVVKLVDVRNTGVAFSLFSGGGTVVLVITLLALAALVAYFLARPGRRLLWLPTGLLLGGAIGNIIDRVRESAVTDFIKLPHWPAFNAADVAITVGVVVLVYTLEFGSRGRAREAGDG